MSRFYRIYNAVGGYPGAEQLRREYLDPGSDGLHQIGQLAQRDRHNNRQGDRRAMISGSEAQC